MIHAYVKWTQVGGPFIRACIGLTAVLVISRVIAYFQRITVRGGKLGKYLQRSRIRTLRGG